MTRADMESGHGAPIDPSGSQAAGSVNVIEDAPQISSRPEPQTATAASPPVSDRRIGAGT